MDTSKPVATDNSDHAEEIKQSSDVVKDVTAHQRIGTERTRNIHLIWLDGDIDENNADYWNTIKQLKGIVNNINTYTDGDQCVQFIQTIPDSKICMIISDAFEQEIVPRVHALSQVDTIFIFNNNKQGHEERVKEWPKIKGIFTELSPMCEALKQAVQQCEQNMIPISFVTTQVSDQSSTIWDRFDSSFIYIQVIKEILLTIDFNEIHLDEFIAYCREVFDNDDDELENINQFNRDYYSKKPIWWYTWESFLSRMLNRALRSVDISIIVRMGFFIDDLDRNIQRLHSEQFSDDESEKSFTVYRGQGLSKEQFEQLSKLKDGFMSFNDFLLTSKNRDVSLHSAQQAATNPDLVGVVFVMNIDATQSTIPFASIAGVSYLHTEDEVLFSMHTVFRIDNMKPMDANTHLYEVTLTLTSDNDKDLRKISDRIREETFPDQKGWQRLGQMLLKMKQFSKAEGVYEILLEQTTYESGKAPIYHQLGWIKYNQGEYQAALTFYDKSLSISQETLPPNHINLASSHANIGVVHYSMGDYPKALSSYEKLLEIRQKTLPANHLDLASSHHDIAMIYNNMNEYSEALLSYEQSLQIRQQALPPNHPDLNASYNNIGMVHYNMGNYSKALSFYEKAFRIQQQTLPPDHPDSAVYYNNIGMVYNNMGDYPKALSSYEKALQIRKKGLPANHPDLATSYNNLGMMQFQMGNTSDALSSYEKALQIRQKVLPANHPDLGDSYNNIGLVHHNMSNYEKALSSYEKALEIKQQSLLPNHPSLGSTYNNIGTVYINMGDYHKALSAHENALQIRQQSLPPHHADLAMSFGHTGNLYNRIGEHSKALPFCQRAVDIAQQSLPSNHPHFQWYRTVLQEVEKNL